MVIRAEGEAMAAKLISDALRNGQVTNASMNRSMYLFTMRCEERALYTNRERGMPRREQLTESDSSKTELICMLICVIWGQHQMRSGGL